MSSTALLRRIERIESTLTRETIVPIRPPDELTTLELLLELGPPDEPVDIDPQYDFLGDFQDAVAIATVLLRENAYRRETWLPNKDCPELLRGLFSDEVVTEVHRSQRNYVGNGVRKWRLAQLLTDDNTIADDQVGYVFEGRLNRIMNRSDHDMFPSIRDRGVFEYIYAGEQVPEAMMPTEIPDPISEISGHAEV